jgi:hypothetical protein
MAIGDLYHHAKARDVRAPADVKTPPHAQAFAAAGASLRRQL